MTHLWLIYQGPTAYKVAPSSRGSSMILLRLIYISFGTLSTMALSFIRGFLLFVRGHQGFKCEDGSLWLICDSFTKGSIRRKWEWRSSITHLWQTYRGPSAFLVAPLLGLIHQGLKYEGEVWLSMTHKWLILQGLNAYNGTPCSAGSSNRDSSENVMAYETQLWLIDSVTVGSLFYGLIHLGLNCECSAWLICGSYQGLEIYNRLPPL